MRPVITTQKPISTSKKVYLPGLHGLRFLAAFSVFFGHLEQAKSWVGYPGFLDFPIAQSIAMASDGVTLFFVLSGFLITYLLLTEHETTGSIDIPQFYTRRILRIWPLYYLFTFLTFVVLPQIPSLQFPHLDMKVSEDFWKRLGLYLLLSPHVSNLMFAHPGVGGPLWSVGVEEYFYLTWPHVIKRLRPVLPWVFATVIVMPIFFRSQGILFHGSAFLRGFFWDARFDCMGIGGLGAWMYVNQRKRIGLVFSRPIQVVACLLAVLNSLFPVNYGRLNNTVDCLVFVTIIMNVGLNPQSLIKLENRFFRFMGEISYGLYVFQWLAIVICVNLLIHFGGVENHHLRSVVLLLAAFALTTGFASLSYFIWERKFLRLKAKYAPIVAGMTARKQL